MKILKLTDEEVSTVIGCLMDHCDYLEEELDSENIDDESKVAIPLEVKMIREVQYKIIKQHVNQ